NPALRRQHHPRHHAAVPGALRRLQGRLRRPGRDHLLRGQPVRHRDGDRHARRLHRGYLTLPERESRHRRGGHEGVRVARSAGRPQRGSHRRSLPFGRRPGPRRRRRGDRAHPRPTSRGKAVPQRRRPHRHRRRDRGDRQRRPAAGPRGFRKPPGLRRVAHAEGL
ncbi:MAG: Short-chain dehydrogenase/reductase SDR, partial [uncultured Nocardioidaceae bacterium]